MTSPPPLSFVGLSTSTTCLVVSYIFLHKRVEWASCLDCSWSVCQRLSLTTVLHRNVVLYLKDNFLGLVRFIPQYIIINEKNIRCFFFWGFNGFFQPEIFSIELYSELYIIKKIGSRGWRSIRFETTPLPILFYQNQLFAAFPTGEK